MSDWGTSTGLIEEFTYKIEEAFFGTNSQYRGGDAMLLQLTGIQEVDGEVIDPEYEIWLSTGNNWRAVQGGQVVEHGQGRKMFHRDSGMGNFVNALLAILPQEELDALGKPYEANTFLKLPALQMERKHLGSFTTQEKDDDGNAIVRERYAYLPVGVADGSPKAEAAGAASSGESEIKTKVIAFAKKYDDHGEFLAAVMDRDQFSYLDDLQGFQELYDDIFSDSGEVWTAARG